MELLLNYLHNADGSYDLYLSATYVNYAYTLLVHGATVQEFKFDGSYTMLGYVKLAEGDTWEFHQPLNVSGTYCKTTYTVSGGAVSIVGEEHGTNTTIVAAS